MVDKSSQGAVGEGWGQVLVVMTGVCGPFKCGRVGKVEKRGERRHTGIG